MRKCPGENPDTVRCTPVLKSLKSKKICCSKMIYLRQCVSVLVVKTRALNPHDVLCYELHGSSQDCFYHQIGNFFMVGMIQPSSTYSPRRSALLEVAVQYWPLANNRCLPTVTESVVKHCKSDMH